MVIAEAGSLPRDVEDCGEDDQDCKDVFDVGLAQRGATPHALGLFVPAITQQLEFNQARNAAHHTVIAV